MSDPFKLSLTLLIKLGSIAVHADEMRSPDAHEMDTFAMASLLDDPEVKEWIAAMDKMAFMPKKRNGKTRRT